MTSPLTMPALGADVNEGTIARWLIKVGDTFNEGDPIAEVSTDKVDVEIPAPCTGALETIVAEEDTTVTVGDTIATYSIVDTVERPGPALTLPDITTPDDNAVPPDVANSSSADGQADGACPTSRVEKLSRIRRTIGTRMMESLHSSAQLTTVVEADVTALAALRRSAKVAFRERTGVSLSYFPFFAKAVVDALPHFPMLNASITADGSEATYHGPCHLGIAVDTERGLLVPVVRDAHRLSVPELAMTIAQHAERTRSRTITADELTGATFTITNTGSRGALFDTPILNPPQTGILGTGQVVDRVVPIQDGNNGHALVVRSMILLSLTYDHRLVDGADAARFLSAIRQRVEAADFSLTA